MSNPWDPPEGMDPHSRMIAAEESDACERCGENPLSKLHECPAVDSGKLQKDGGVLRGCQCCVECTLKCLKASQPIEENGA